VAKLIEACGVVTEVWPKNGEVFSLEELQGYVGGYVEPLYLEGDKVALMDEDGRFKHLRVNDVASVQLGRYIVGPVLIGSREEMDI